MYFSILLNFVRVTVSILKPDKFQETHGKAETTVTVICFLFVSRALYTITAEEMSLVFPEPIWSQQLCFG